MYSAYGVWLFVKGRSRFVGHRNNASVAPISLVVPRIPLSPPLVWWCYAYLCLPHWFGGATHTSVAPIGLVVLRIPLSPPLVWWCHAYLCFPHWFGGTHTSVSPIGLLATRIPLLVCWSDTAPGDKVASWPMSKVAAPGAKVAGWPK